MISLFCPLFHWFHLDGFWLLQIHCVQNWTLDISLTVYFSGISILLFIPHFPSNFYYRRLETFLWALSLTSRAQLIQALSFLSTKCQWAPLTFLLKVTTSVLRQAHLHWRCSESLQTITCQYCALSNLHLKESQLTWESFHNLNTALIPLWLACDESIS